jgi:protein gp37
VRRCSVSIDAHWDKPLRWNAKAAAEGVQRRVFPSVCDPFDNEVDPQRRAQFFTLIAGTPHLTWLLLSKRIGNAKSMLPADWGDGYPNVWLGSTLCNREEMLRDGAKLKAVPARVHFWSVEPMLGDLGHIPLELMPEWGICGGESGAGARPMPPAWPRRMRDQFAAAGRPWLFKQWGEFLPAAAKDDDPGLADVPESRIFWSDGTKWDRFDGQRGGVDLVARVGKKHSGRLLDGRTHDEFPGQGAVVSVDE